MYITNTIYYMILGFWQCIDMVPSGFFKINLLNLMLDHAHTVMRIFAFKFFGLVNIDFYIYVFLK